MRIPSPVSSAAFAFLVLAAACLLQAAPATAQRICGDTAVEVRIHVFERRHAEGVGRILWSNCARRTYGDEWSDVDLARGGRDGDRLVCYSTHATRGYYSSRHIVTCSGGDVRAPRWVCYYRATPCRYRYNGHQNGEDEDD
jgi:hypothetical protein